jgi:protein tyrosine/serine phosphatase
VLGNYHVVDAEVSRSAQPQPADFPFVLANFKSTLDLQDEDEDIVEQNELTPLKVLAGNISDLEIYARGLFTLARMMNIIEAAKLAPKPMLVHCKNGWDRTGLFVAFWRVLVDGWTCDAAWAEAKEYGYHWFNFGLTKVWKQFRRQYEAKP